MFFWKKKKMDLKRGDVVSVKKGVKFPELNIDISDWRGRVFEVNKRSAEVELDSVTLQNFDVEILDHFIDILEYPHIITMPFKDIEKSESRDNYDEVEILQDELIDKIELNNKEPHFLKLSRKWMRHFIRSDYYWEMDKRNREDADSVIELFTSQMNDYEDKTPKKWNVKSAREVFLHWAPNKITADTDFFESYGIVLIEYFKFLEERKYLKTKSLLELLVKVKDEIVFNSQNSANWGMAKSFLMKAKGAGVDLENKKQLDKFLLKQQVDQLKSLSPEEQSTKIESSKKIQKQLKGIWRNQKITVKYNNGELKEGVKFKDVEQDLLKGLCVLIAK